MLNDTARVPRKFCRSVQSEVLELERLHQSIEDQLATARELIKVACILIENAQVTSRILDAVRASTSVEFG